MPGLWDLFFGSEESEEDKKVREALEAAQKRTQEQEQANVIEPRTLLAEQAAKGMTEGMFDSLWRDPSYLKGFGASNVKSDLAKRQAIIDAENEALAAEELAKQKDLFLGGTNAKAGDKALNNMFMDNQALLNSFKQSEAQGQKPVSLAPDRPMPSGPVKIGGADAAAELGGIFGKLVGNHGNNPGNPNAPGYNISNLPSPPPSDESVLNHAKDAGWLRQLMEQYTAGGNPPQAFNPTPEPTPPPAPAPNPWDDMSKFGNAPKSELIYDPFFGFIDPKTGKTPEGIDANTGQPLWTNQGNNPGNPNAPGYFGSPSTKGAQNPWDDMNHDGLPPAGGNTGSIQPETDFAGPWGAPLTKDGVPIRDGTKLNPAVQAMLDKQPETGSDKGGFLDNLSFDFSVLGPALAALDPRNAGLAAGLLDNANSRRKANEEQAKMAESQKAAYDWLIGQGMSEQDAAFLSSNPDALEQWWTNQNSAGDPSKAPDTRTQTLIVSREVV